MNAVPKLGTHFSLDALDSLVNKVKYSVDWTAKAMASQRQRPSFLRSTPGSVLARLAALEAENTALAKENAALKSIAYTDYLTGLPNRCAFMAAVRMEQARMQRSGQSACLVLADVDFFKAVNDRFGHTKGDQLLQWISRTLGTSVRATDTIARWGGEEFVMLLPETEQLGAWHAAEKCRKAIQSGEQGAHHSVTMTFGITQLDGAEDIEQVIARADKALYQGKRNGRNRTELSALVA